MHCTRPSGRSANIMSRIDYLGHAGFRVEHRDQCILIDPFFYPAFLASWFPDPDNRFLLEETLRARVDYLYISHTHEDHFDHRFLKALNKDVQVLCPNYRSKSLERRLRALGFNRIIALAHKQSVELSSGLRATIYLDTGHKEDSALLLEMDGFRFFDMNDCNTPLSELPTGIDLLAAQYSGAMWYPNCYDYPPDLMRDKVARVRSDLMHTLLKKCEVTHAAAYLPSAGPPCFLDPCLAQFNDHDATIFPVWKDVEAEFRRAMPQIRVLSLDPADSLRINDGAMQIDPYAGQRPNADLTEYSERRRAEWQAFHDAPKDPLSSAEIAAYFATLQRRNKHVLGDFSKTLRLNADGQVWTVRLGELAQDFVIDGEEPYDPQYSLLIPTQALRAILEGSIGWEEALLSLRLRLQRNPDVFDSRFMGLLRYGNEPAQTLQMAREMASTESIERDGLRLQRFCPHAGEDLTYATICNGVIECPRHHWKWDVRTGKCIEGGSLNLRIEPLADTESQPATATAIDALTK